MLEKGLVQLYTGNGKGKSTSGFGTIARAVGHGLNAAVVQLIKGTWACGERALLENAGVSFDVMATGFTWNTQDKALDIAAAQKVWQRGKELLKDNNVDVSTLKARTELVLKSSFNGKRIVIFSGGAAKSTDDVLEEVKGLAQGGSFGSIMGRNAFQRPKAEAVSLLNSVMDIYSGHAG